MSNVAELTTQDALALAWPDLRRAPAIFRSAVKLAARTWHFGGITFVLPAGREIPIRGAEPGPAARLIIHDYRCMARVMSAGDIGFAEGYMAGEWDTPDLPALLESASLNFERIQQLGVGNPIMQAVNFIGHLLRPNDRQGSRKNIHAHYDLGNAFYGRWLDPTMTYSSANFERPDQPLAEAQTHKYATLARSMELRPGNHVLEIGCGWGGFAEFAAKEVGAKVTGITISTEQYDFAKKRMFEQGLAERADIQLIDYRDVEGAFDRVASIEMFEAVGERYWPTYFEKIRDVMAPGGRAGLQIITIRDELFDHYRSHADFIQKYVFPGGMLGSERRLRQETDRVGLEWRAISRFGQSYADTLAQWGANFQNAWEDIKLLGFDEAGFRSERTNVIQLSLSKG